MPSKPKRRGRRPNFLLAFKLALVEQSMQPGVSTARLAREHGINDNLLFNWRNLYKQGRLGPTLPACCRLNWKMYHHHRPYRVKIALVVLIFMH